MGNDWRFWFIPTNESVEGNGIEFPTCIHHEKMNSYQLEHENDQNDELSINIQSVEK